MRSALQIEKVNFRDLVPLLLGIILFTNQSASLAAYSANSDTRQATRVPSPLGQPAKNRGAAQPSATSTTQSVPGWWRQEWARRQQDMRIARWLQAKERLTDSKAFWNPRTPQSLALRHAMVSSHGGAVPSWSRTRLQSVSTTSTRTTLPQSQSSSTKANAGH
jgi:hypothetical protein